MADSAPSAPKPNAALDARMAYVMLTLTAMFFGGNWPIIRAVRDDVPPYALAFWRWAIAALIVLPFVLPRLRAAWPVLRKEAPHLAFFGIAGVAGFAICGTNGLQTTQAINGALLNAASPVFVILIVALFFRERIGWLQILGLVTAIAGVLAIIARGAPQQILATGIGIGDVWIMVAVALWSLYTVMLRHWRTALDPTMFLFGTIVCGLAVMGPAYAVEAYTGRRIELNAGSIAGIAYLAIFPSIGSYLFWSLGVARVGAARASVFQYLIPAFAAVFSILFIGEELRPFHLAGAALIIGGIVIANRRAPPRAAG